MELFLVIFAALGLAALGIAFFALAKAFLIVGRPNEVVVFSGGNYRSETGGSQGWYAMFGGRRYRIPILEKVDRLDLTLMSVNIVIHNAYSKGGIPLSVHAIANVKVSSNPRLVGNAIERFLGSDKQEILRVAKETLEGHVRGVLASMTPEEINENRLKFAEELHHEATPDFEKLGLHLDVLKIQNVADDRDYLESIGRTRIAEIIKVAEVAESDAMKSAEEIEAQAQGQGEVARRNAQAQIQKMQNELREYQAQLEQLAKSAEERAEAGALTARAEAEQELQQVRTELEKFRLQADVVIPAEAEKVAREVIAAGEAAEIAEKGRAMAMVLSMMSNVWKEAGPDAMDVFIIHRLESIMKQVAEAANQVTVREVALIDSGDGTALPNYVSSFPRIVGNLFDEMRDTVGLDIGGALTGDHREVELVPRAQTSPRKRLGTETGRKARSLDAGSITPSTTESDNS
ncbi:flotillin family protein [Bradymonas sediminis]|uniref:Flotillin family protein n=1 Tax=Bradymonas sediminis TaxID=1548548 RepID=A0A2Z4FI47_9DELT|nr:flotillin family protein [Bradymonas sediminis]AWV88378.1 flotillin family protein [Bradymonas sediminis]TDP77505.1 flotillin [Bradymonas sediminis]